MIYGSVCSGIEAATVAWHSLGWTPAFFAEIEKFPCAVLAHHYPDVPNHGDMTKFKEWPDATIDALVGGTPCQSFSVAGLRKGLTDPRGNLMLTFCAIAQRYRPRWLVWENVPGVLSSNRGRDFASFLRALEELGYGWAYRVLDAQYFGVPQRRRRVFVVGYLGDWRRAAAVLFERESLLRNPPPRRETREETSADVAPCIGASGRGFSRTGDPRGQDAVVATTLRSRDLGRGVDSDCTDTLVAHSLRAEGFDAGEDGTGRGIPLVAAFGGNNTGGPIDVATARNACNSASGRMDFESETFLVSEAPICFNARQDPDVSGDMASAIGTKDTGHAVAFPIERGNQGGGGNIGFGREGDPSFTLQKSHAHAVAFAQNTRDEVREMPVAGALNSATGTHQTSYVRNEMQVRRLTPKECARLQGFPDDYSDIIYNKKPAKDGPKYKAIGNSFAVPVVRYIGRRIDLVEHLN